LTKIDKLFLLIALFTTEYTYPWLVTDINDTCTYSLKTQSHPQGNVIHICLYKVNVTQNDLAQGW